MAPLPCHNDPFSFPPWSAGHAARSLSSVSPGWPVTAEGRPPAPEVTIRIFFLCMEGSCACSTRHWLGADVGRLLWADQTIQVNILSLSANHIAVKLSMPLGSFQRHAGKLAPSACSFLPPFHGFFDAAVLTGRVMGFCLSDILSVPVCP